VTVLSYLLQDEHGVGHGFAHGFGQVLHGAHKFGMHQPLIHEDADWNRLSGHDGHVTHGFAHGVAQGVEHGFAHVLHGVESPANTGMANDTANTAINATTANFFIVNPPFRL
jgi:hypothetical protein